MANFIFVIETMSFPYKFLSLLRETHLKYKCQETPQHLDIYMEFNENHLTELMVEGMVA